jgi:hypothetical protein
VATSAPQQEALKWERRDQAEQRERRQEDRPLHPLYTCNIIIEALRREELRERTWGLRREEEFVIRMVVV